MIYRHRSVFFSAFRRAVGRQSKPVSYPQMRVWMREAARLVTLVIRAADAAGMDAPARKAFVLHIEARDVSMETILAAVKYHATKEYPYLLNNEIDHILTVIYATNLNDQHLVQRLSEAPNLDDALQQAIITLHTHLNAIPSLSPQ